MPRFSVNDPILVTGGAGFLGQAVVARLEREGYRSVFVPRSRDYDLVHEANVQRLYAAARPRAVIHLAARGWHRRQPGQSRLVLLRQPHDGRAAIPARSFGTRRSLTGSR